MYYVDLLNFVVNIIFSVYIRGRGEGKGCFGFNFSPFRC